MFNDWCLIAAFFNLSTIGSEKSLLEILAGLDQGASSLYPALHIWNTWSLWKKEKKKRNTKNKTTQICLKGQYTLRIEVSKLILSRDTICLWKQPWISVEYKSSVEATNR